jgi:hypothetical protein
MTNRSQKDLQNELMMSGRIPLEASYLSNVEAKKGFLGNIYNPRKVSMTFSRALPPINAPGSPASTSVTPAAAQASGNITSAQNNTPAASGVPRLLNPNNVSTTQPVSFDRNYLGKPTEQYTPNLQQSSPRSVTGLSVRNGIPGVPTDPGVNSNQVTPTPNPAIMEYMQQVLTPPQTVDISGVGPIDLSNQDEIDALNIREKNILQRSYNNNSSIQKTGYKNPNLFQKGGSTLYDIVKSKGYDPSFESRKKIFQDYFDEPYTGTYEQNSTLKKELLSGNIQLINDITRKKNTEDPKTVEQSKTTNVSSRSSQINQSNNQKTNNSKEVNQAKKQNTKEINKVKVETPPLLKRRNGIDYGIDFRNTGNSPFQGDGYYEDKDLRSNLESGVIVDKATGTVNFVRAGKIDQEFPVLTGLAGKNYETDPNANPYPVPYLRNNPAARSTPTGTYKMKYDKSIYGYPGYYQKPIAAFGKKAPIATTPLAMHVVYGAGAKPGYTWDPSQGVGAKPYYNPEEYQSRLKRFNEPDNRFGSYGCTNFEPYSLECLTERFGTEGDTAVYIDSRNPEDKRFIENFPIAPPLKNKQNGGQLYLYRNGGLPTFQSTGEYVLPSLMEGETEVSSLGKTFGDINPMEEFNTSLLDQQRKTVNLPTKSLQERAAEAGANPSMKTLKADFVKNPLSASQWADIAYSGTNLVTNLKNRADQESAQARMLEEETDPINYTPSTFANFNAGIEENLYGPARKYTSFMGQRQEFSPGVSSGFAKFGGIMKMGGTYEMDLSPEEIAYIQQMGGTIEYI